MADGNDYNLLLLKEQGQPVEAVYASEGSPLIIVPSGVFKNAPNPNAARLFQSFFLGVEGQQLLVDNFAHRSFHAAIKEKPGRQPLSAFEIAEVRSRRRAGAERGHQGALRQAFQGVISFGRGGVGTIAGHALFRTVLLNITLFQKIPASFAGSPD